MAQVQFYIHRRFGNIVQVNDKFWDDEDLRPATRQEIKANGFGSFLKGDKGEGTDIVAIAEKLQMPDVEHMDKQQLNAFCVDHNLAQSIASNRTALPVMRATVVQLVQKRNAYIDSQNRTDHLADESIAADEAPILGDKEGINEDVAMGVGGGTPMGAMTDSHENTGAKDAAGNEVV